MSPRIALTPESEGWRFLSFAVHQPASAPDVSSADQETAIVPLSGTVTATVDGRDVELSRTSVFEQMPNILYAPPGASLVIEGDGECAVGSAPAEGKYEVRVFTPDEMKTEIRGGGAARRQVVHALAPPLPAERLILYEVYVPRGMWSGWPPHCHDGYDGSPYLEETYYFRMNPAEGFCMHRNWRVDEPFDETFVCGDRGLALVTKGYHSTASAPGSHMFFLNYLAGDLIAEERTTPPCFHDDYTWIEDNWEEGEWELPVVTP